MSQDKDQLIEDYLNAADDAVQAGQTEKDLLAPAGTYTTMPGQSFTWTPKVKEDEPNKGRFSVRYFGPARMVKTVVDKETGESKEVAVEARFGFGLSHVRVNKKDSHEPDLQHKLFIRARRAYIEAYGSEPETNKDVYEYVRDYPTKLRVIQVGVPTERNPNPDGEPGNIVLDISPVRE